jgi:AraC-like DNA-binding protein
MQKGDIFIFNNIEAHRISRVDPGEELVNVVIMFDPRFIWSIESNLFDSRYLSVFFNRGGNFRNRLEHGSLAANEIGKLFVEIEEEFRKKAPEYELMVKVKLLNILVLLIRHYGQDKLSGYDAAKQKHGLVTLNKVIEYIDGHLNENIRQEELAGIAYMNPSYFSTFFKKYIGLSPFEYILKKRVSRAAEYLASTDRTILEIAGLCGFNNAANFNKAFKKVIGKVPSEYRKKPAD